MPKLTIESNLYTKAEGVSYLLKDALTYRPKGYIFSPQYKLYAASKKSGSDMVLGWDGTVSLFKEWQAGYFFPTGLLQYCLDHLALNDVIPEVEDKRVAPKPGVIMFSSRPQIALEEHQEEAVRASIAAERGVIYYPTGTGKSVIIGELIRRLRVSMLVLVPTKVLANQLPKQIERLTGAPCGVLGDGKWNPGPVTVATWQSITNRLLPRKGRHPKESASLKKEMQELLATFDGVIADEGHHIQAASFEAVMKALPAAYYRYCFSATPFKSGGQDDRETLLRVQAWTGPVSSYLSISGGIETKRIVPPDIHIIHLPRLPDLGGPAPINYKEEVEAYIVRNGPRNGTIVRLAQRVQRAGPTVILIERTAHGAAIAQRLGCPFVAGATKSSEREHYWKLFRSNKLPCLVISKIGDEALDLPNIRFLILAAGGKAAHRQVQRIGRGMRADEGKTHLAVFDFADPDGEYLPSHYRARRRAYDREPAYTVSDISADELEEILK